MREGEGSEEKKNKRERSSSRAAAGKGGRGVLERGERPGHEKDAI
jgi:hypothetical protein